MPAAPASSPPSFPVPATVIHTACCIVGGGPGGMMLALLLARRGVDVTLLEANPTFERDFRGDTVHPGLLELLDQIGLADRLHQCQHVKLYGPTVPIDGKPTMVFDFRQLLRGTRFPYIMVIPQQDFLGFLAAEGVKLPNFRLVMGANVRRLIGADGHVRGVQYRAADGWHEVRAPLTIGADGRFSLVRKLSGLPAITTSSPLELLWFKLPRLPSDPPSTGLGGPRFGLPGRSLLIIDRADHWQAGCLFPAGDYRKVRAAGVEGMRQTIVALEPSFAPHVEYLTEWGQFSHLSVASARCPRWYKRGLLLIGDAAHTMTPAAGSGIKYAIEDAVVAANLLAGPLKQGRVRIQDLHGVQRRREWPTRFVQAFGALALKGIARRLKSPAGQRGLPLPMRVVFRTPILNRLFAHMIAFGFRRERVEN